jgi:hypothetical protein
MVSVSPDVGREGGLNREILDQGWADFVLCLTDKAEEAGSLVVRVDRNGTSQECPACGGQAPKDLRQRIHRCADCGFTEDRDVAAAQVIASRAAAQFNGAAERRVEDAPQCAPRKPNPAADGLARENRHCLSKPPAALRSGVGLNQNRDVAAAHGFANRAAHMLNGSGESRVEDAPRGAPKKPNRAANNMRRESSLPQQAATTPHGAHVGGLLLPRDPPNASSTPTALPRSKK